MKTEKKQRKKILKNGFLTMLTLFVMLGWGYFDNKSMVDETLGAHRAGVITHKAISSESNDYYIKVDLKHGDNHTVYDVSRTVYSMKVGDQVSFKKTDYNYNYSTLFLLIPLLVFGIITYVQWIDLEE